jgi:hypothetical protein
VFMNGVQKWDYARTGVNVICGGFFSGAHSASHFSQLNEIVPPMIRINLVPVGIGITSGHGWSGTVSDIKHFDTYGHAPTGNSSCCRYSCAIYGDVVQ